MLALDGNKLWRRCLWVCELLVLWGVVWSLWCGRECYRQCRVVSVLFVSGCVRACVNILMIVQSDTCRSCLSHRQMRVCANRLLIGSLHLTTCVYVELWMTRHCMSAAARVCSLMSSYIHTYIHTKKFIERYSREIESEVDK